MEKTMNQSSNPSDFVLLKSIYDSSEMHFVCGLLESHDIAVHVDAKVGAHVIVVTSSNMPRWDIYVHENDIVDARKLLESSEDYDADKYLKDYSENNKRKGMIGGRIISLIMSALFFAISNLPMKESDSSMKYVLLGASLFFILLFIFSFRWGEEN